MVYVSAEVQAVRELYDGLLDDRAWLRSAEEQLLAQAERLADGHRHRDRGALVELSNWHPSLVGRSADDIWSTTLTDDDFLLTLARGHGFVDWTAVGDAHPSVLFESCVDAVLGGEISILAERLRRAPSVVTQRSHWGHRATLLHYLAANGVEIHRQVVPGNAAAVAELLLAHGAGVDATATAYGGELTALDLLLSSAHPAHAGVTAELAAVLRSAMMP